MYGRTLFLFASCVLPIIAAPLPLENVSDNYVILSMLLCLISEQVENRAVSSPERRSTNSLSNLLPAILKRVPTIEAIPDMVIARGHGAAAGGSRRDIDARGGRTGAGGGTKRDIDARGGRTGAGGGTKRDIDARGGRTGAGGGTKTRDVKESLHLA
jgi:hypothetical protein